MKMFRSDGRKEYRHERTEEEFEELEAMQRVSPGKVLRTTRRAIELDEDARRPRWSAQTQGSASVPSPRRPKPNSPIDDRALFGMTRSGDADGLMLGKGADAMKHLAWRPEAASMRPSARPAGAVVQGKGIDELPTSAIEIAATGGGEALPEEVRAKMEAMLGMDFSGVRVHVGPQAASMGALAFTRGTDIFFAPGNYQPGTRHGQELLGHELTHVVQQSEGRVGASQDVAGVGINDDRGLEREADEMGARAASDKPVAGSPRSDTPDTRRFASRRPDHADATVRGQPARVAGPATKLQRKEVNTDAEIQSPKDWTKADREGSTQRWKTACLTNLNAVDRTQYVKVVERRDFYKWFYDHTAALGYTTRWALAARLVADGAHQIADMDEDHAWSNDALGMANVELQGVMRQGNQVIFDNVLPKLKKLLDGGPLKGPAALRWDMKILAEEQALIQPLYSGLSPATVKQIDYIARKKRFAGLGAKLTGGDKVPGGPHNNEGRVPAFDQPDIKNVEDRWKYGMGLGDKFTPGGSGYDPDQHAMPTPGSGYTDGSELAKVNTRPNLHQLDAWLNPNRLARASGTPGSDYKATIAKLTPFEKTQVLQDQSPNGWAYSKQFAQFSFIDEATVQSALPVEPGQADAVKAFMARFKTERRRVQRAYPQPYMPMGF